MEIEPVSSYGLGYLARLRGIKKESNPFSEVGQMHTNWDRGWDHADKDISPKAKVVKLRKVISMKLVK